MATSTRVLLALVVGIGIGWLGGYLVEKQRAARQVNTDTPPKTRLTSQNQIIMVGPKAADLDNDPAQISISGKHKVTWSPTEDGTTLKITFDRLDFPNGAESEPPFDKKDHKPNETQELKNCTRTKPCEFQINPNLESKIKKGKPGLKLYYKYSQALQKGNDPIDEADGLIIIER